MKFFAAFLFLASTFSCTLALDQPTGAVSRIYKNGELDRDLFWFGGEKKCRRQLAKCQNANNVFAPPFDGWIEMLTNYLGNLDGNPDDSLLSDLIDLILNLGSINMNTLADDLNALVQDLANDALEAGLVMLQDLAKGFLQGYVSPNVEGFIEAGVNTLNAFGESTLAPMLSANLLPAIMSVLELMQNLAFLIPGENSDLLGAATGDVVTFLSTLATVLMQLLVPRAGEDMAALAGCSAQLVQCKYDAMVVQVMPEVIGTTLTAVAVEEQRRRQRD